MKGIIKDKTIVLIEPLPKEWKDGDEVEVSVVLTGKRVYPFPVFDLGIKDDYLSRERIYEPDSPLS